MEPCDPQVKSMEVVFDTYILIHTVPHFQASHSSICSIYLVIGHDSGTDLLDVPTIYKAYVRAMEGDIPPEYGQNMVQYLHFRILEISH